jgi:hypothetical protein
MRGSVNSERSAGKKIRGKIEFKEKYKLKGK